MFKNASKQNPGNIPGMGGSENIQNKKYDRI
jgi:hypothetical protein